MNAFVKVKPTVKEDPTNLKQELVDPCNNLKDTSYQLITEAEKLLCQEGLISSRLETAHVQFIRGSGDDDSYIREFTSGPFSRASSNIEFRENPIGVGFKTDEPLILLSDSYEIDKDADIRLTKRQNAGAKSFPVIIFDDYVFQKHPGEVFGYLPIIESLERACGCKAMAFKRGDLNSKSVYLILYVDYISYWIKLYNLKNAIQATCNYLFGELSELEKIAKRLEKSEKNTSSEIMTMLACRIKVNAVFERLDRINDLIISIDNELVSWDGILTKLRETYDKHIDALVSDSPSIPDAPFAIYIDLKYATFRNQTKQFIEKIQNSPLTKLQSGTLFIPTEQNIQETNEKLDADTSELALLGTFSSGKTTMINSLLGDGHKLRTSLSHNTAVLMKLEYSEDERYDVEFKNRLIWNLIKPASFDHACTNPFKEKAKVMNIRFSPEEYIIDLRSINSKVDFTLRIRKKSDNDLVISKNEIVNPGQPLVRTESDSDLSMLASYNELDTLERYIKENKLGDPKIFTDSGPVSGRERVLNFITRLKHLEIYKKYTSSQQTVKTNDVQNVLNHQLLNARIEADIKMSSYTEKLDEPGWIKLFGNTDNQNADANHPFSEQPVCYMFVDCLRLHLKRDFLKNCKVNDTPGFGSITEEHDACTERFIQETSSRLLVMISLNKTTTDAKLVDFLNYLSNIYENFRKDQMNEVYFMLNEFKGSVTKEHMEKSAKLVTDMLIKRGFSRENIFACDLNSAIHDGVHLKQLYGLPSYDVFKDKCIHKILETGISRNYISIYNSWENYFNKNRPYVEDRIRNLEKALDDRESRKEKLKRDIDRVKSLNIKSLDGVFSQAGEKYDFFFQLIDDAFRYTKKIGLKFWKDRPRRDAIEEAVDSIKTSLRDLDALDNDVRNLPLRAYTELGIITGLCEDESFFNEFNRQRFFTLAIENIRNTVLNADKDVGILIHKSSDTEYHMRNIKTIFNADLENSKKSAREYYNKCYAKFEVLKRNILNTLESEYKSIENSETIKTNIASLKMVRQNLEQYKRKFAETVNKMNIRIKED